MVNLPPGSAPSNVANRACLSSLADTLVSLISKPGRVNDLYSPIAFLAVRTLRGELAGNSCENTVPLAARQWHDPSTHLNLFKAAAQSALLQQLERLDSKLSAVLLDHIRNSKHFALLFDSVFSGANAQNFFDSLHSGAESQVASDKGSAWLSSPETIPQATAKEIHKKLPQYQLKLIAAFKSACLYVAPTLANESCVQAAIGKSSSSVSRHEANPREFRLAHYYAQLFEAFRAANVPPKHPLVALTLARIVQLEMKRQLYEATHRLINCDAGTDYKKFLNSLGLAMAGARETEKFARDIYPNDDERMLSGALLLLRNDGFSGVPQRKTNDFIKQMRVSALNAVVSDNKLELYKTGIQLTLAFPLALHDGHLPFELSSLKGVFERTQAVVAHALGLLDSSNLVKMLKTAFTTDSSGVSAVFQREQRDFSELCGKLLSSGVPKEYRAALTQVRDAITGAKDTAQVLEDFDKKRCAPLIKARTRAAIEYVRPLLGEVYLDSDEGKFYHLRGLSFNNAAPEKAFVFGSLLFEAKPDSEVTSHSGGIRYSPTVVQEKIESGTWKNVRDSSDTGELRVPSPVSEAWQRNAAAPVSSPKIGERFGLFGNFVGEVTGFDGSLVMFRIVGMTGVERLKPTILIPLKHLDR